MGLFFHSATPKLHHHLSLLHIRTFVDAKVKWVRDPYLDKVVSREKNLKSILSLKSLILSHPSKTLPISTLSPLLHLPTTAAKFFQEYPTFFKIFQPSKPLSLPHVKLTPQALYLHKQETQILNSPSDKRDLAERLTKLLMLTKIKKIPFSVLEKFKHDLGLPQNYILTLLPDFPDYFQICDMGFKDSNGCDVLGLELISWREDLAVSVMQHRTSNSNCGIKRGRCIEFPTNLPRGFDLEKKVKNWMEKWQDLPYISPYEDTFHLSPNSDQMEKWTVGVIHELLHLMVGKKAERDSVFYLGDYLGFGSKRFKKALVHHPGIFYLSNKIRTQTVVLRESFRKDILVENHQLMEMRYRYIDLLNRVWRWGKLIRVPHTKRNASDTKARKRRKENYRRAEVDLHSSSESDEVGM